MGGGGSGGWCGDEGRRKCAKSTTSNLGGDELSDACSCGCLTWFRLLLSSLASKLVQGLLLWPEEVHGKVHSKVQSMLFSITKAFCLCSDFEISL